MPFLRKYGTGSGADIDVPMVKRGVVDFAVSADWSPASGDVKISIDGGAAASITTLPTAVAMGNTAYWKFTFSNAELQGKRIIVTIADAATKAVEDQAFIIETYGNASAMYQADLSSANLPADVKAILGTTLTETTGGNIATGVKKLFDVATASQRMTLASYNQGADNNTLLSDATVGLSNLKTLIDAVKAVVDAITAKTTNLPASPAATSDIPSAATIATAVRDIDNTSPADNSLGSDVKSIKINGVPVTGTNTLTQTQISSAVWAKDTSLLTTSGSIGKRLLDLFSGITSIAQWLGLIAGKQTGDSTALTEIRATGAGSGGFSPTTDSLEAIRDRGDVAWITGSGGLSGALSVPVNVVDDSSVDVAGKVVTVRDQNGVFIGLSDATDSSGNTVLALDAGTYQLVIAANGSYSGYSQTHVISDETEIPIELVKSAREPSAVGLSTGYLTALVNGVATADVEFTRQILFLPSGTGLSESAAPVTARSNIAGLVQFTNHIPDATYIVKRGTGGWVEYVANNSDFELPRVLSEG